MRDKIGIMTSGWQKLIRLGGWPQAFFQPDAPANERQDVRKSCH
jgi:hypothetical protein